MTDKYGKMNDKFDRDGKPLEFMEWAIKMNDAEYKRVARTELGDVLVSTVWLGLNHSWDDGPPLIFETMIFGGPHDDWMDRYSTEAEALAGHERVVAALQAGIPPDAYDDTPISPELLSDEMAKYLDQLFTDPNMGELLIRFANKSRYLRFTKDGRFFYSSNTGTIGP